jgi:NADP-dependent 3-hydroxy acid dehydrogenase YdfG
MLDLQLAYEWRRVFDGLRVVISGGTTGIGRATALLLVRSGARVLTFGRHRKELDDTLADSAGACGALIGRVADQSAAGDVSRVVKDADREIGGLDVLINSAAVGGEDLMEGSDDKVEYTVASNLLGYLLCTRHALERMKPRRAGHIVNIGSISAEKRSAGGEVYTATKSAIRGLSDSLRKGVAEYGIKVSLIEPGLVGTDLIEEPVEAQREKVANLEMLTAEDIAQCICFCLAQPARCEIANVQVVPLRRQ